MANHDDVKNYWGGFPEAPYSDSFKWTDPDGFEHLETVRAWTDEGLHNGIEKIKKLILDKGGLPFGKRPQEPAVIPSQEPVYENVDQNGNKQPEVKVATAGRLSYENKDGKLSWKVMDCVFAPGEKGTKYGLNLYPEVAQAAKLDLREGQPVPDIHGWRVDYVCNDKGYPQKATRLLPPK